MTVTSKFKKDISTLRSAVKGDYYLDVKNPKLFNLIDCIAEDLESVEVA